MKEDPAHLLGIGDDGEDPRLGGDAPGQTEVMFNGIGYPGARVRYVNTASEEYFAWFNRDVQSGSVLVMKIR